MLLPNVYNNAYVQRTFGVPSTLRSQNFVAVSLAYGGNFPPFGSGAVGIVAMLGGHPVAWPAQANWRY